VTVVLESLSSEQIPADEAAWIAREFTSIGLGANRLIRRPEFATDGRELDNLESRAGRLGHGPRRRLRVTR